MNIKIKQNKTNPLSSSRSKRRRIILASVFLVLVASVFAAARFGLVQNIKNKFTSPSLTQQDIEKLPKVEVDAKDVFSAKGGNASGEKGARVDFKAEENPSFDITLPGTAPADAKPVSFLNVLLGTKIANAAESKILKVEVLNIVGDVMNDIKTSTVDTASGANIQALKPDGSFKPGKYSLHIEMLSADGKDVLTSAQDFSWGVLAVNTNKSIYSPGEKAYLQMASLNEFGHGRCDSKLELKITNSGTGEEKTFSTVDGTIQKNGDCNPGGVRDNVTDLPDYFAYYLADQPGTYQMQLTNLDTGYAITDSFEVKENIPFDIERIGATRINPFQSTYKMTLNVKANQDFNGTAVEKLTSGFEITDAGGGAVSDASGGKEIAWNVQLKAGEQKTLEYIYQAPKISPQLFLLGPMEMRENSKVVFQEARQWQIASDATCAISMSSSVNWSAHNWGTCDGSNYPGYNTSGDDVTITATSNAARILTLDVDITSYTIGTITINYNSSYTSRAVTLTISSHVMTTTGNVTINGSSSANDVLTFTTGSLTVGGNVTAGSYGTISFTGAGTLNLKGSLALGTGGVFTKGTGTVQFSGTAQQTIPSAYSYNNIKISNTYDYAGGDGVILNGTTAIGGTLVVDDGASISASAGAMTVTGATTIGTGTSGKIIITSASYTQTFTGALTISANAALTESAAATLAFGAGGVTITGTLTENGAATVGFAGSLTNNGTYTASTGVHTFTGTTKIISGSSTVVIPSLTISGTTTNNGTLTVNTALSGASALTNGNSATLNIGAASAITTLTASGTSNTVNYTGAAQTVHSNTYVNLTLSGSGTDVMQSGTTAISGNFTLSGSVVTTLAANLAITLALSVGDGTTLNVGGYTFSVGTTTTIGAGTSGILNITNATGTKTFTGAVTINASGQITESAAAALVFGNDVTVTGTLTEFGAATASFAGNLTDNGTYTASSGTHTFTDTNGILSGSSTISIATATFSGTGCAYQNNGTFTAGTLLTVTSPAVLTNNGTINASTALAGTGGLTQIGSSILNIGGTSAMGTFTATAGTNTVNYTKAGAQTVLPTSYVNLGISGGGSNIKTIGAGNVTVSATLTVAASTTFDFGTTARTLTLSGAGTTDISNSSGSITMNGSNAAHKMQIAGSSVTIGSLTTGTGSTVEYNASGAQVVSGITYNNLTLSGSGAKTVTGSTVNGILSLEGTATTTGTIPTYGASATLQYKGSAAQTTSTSELGATFAGTGGIIIYNSSGVNENADLTLSGGPLTLTSGAFSIGAHGLTLNGLITQTSGTLTGGASSNISFTGTTTTALPTVTLQNLTINRSGGITMGGDVTVGATLTLTSGTFGVGANTLTLNGPAIAGTPANLSTTSSSNLSFGGSSSSVALPSSVTAINNLTINNSNGVTLNSSLVVSGTLTLTSGTFPVAGNTLTLNGPAIAGTASNLTTTSSSSLVFGGSSASVNIPSSVTAINNLTINNSANDVTLNSSPTISGTLTLTNHALIIGAHTLTLNGALTKTSGTLTGGASSNIYFGDGSGAAATTLPAVTLGTLKVNRVNGITLTGAITVTTLTIGDVTSNSLFYDGGNQVTSTGTLNLTSGKFKLGNSAATTWPAFATNNITAGTTVEYASSLSQTIAAVNYSNLTSSGSGARVLASSGNIGIAQTFTPGTNSYTVTSSTVNLNGTTAQTLGVAFTFNNLTVSNNNGLSSFVTFSDSVTVSGTFTDTTNDSHLKFTHGKTYAFANITINGTTGHNIFMTSDNATPGQTGNTKWLFNVTQAAPTVTYVNVYDSDASGSTNQPIIAYTTTGCVDGGNNLDWSFSSCVAGSTLNVYYSVGQTAADISNNGSSQTCTVGGNCTITISSGTATINFAQTGNIGVGDRVTYNTTSIAYISGKVSATQWTLVTVLGAAPANVGSAQALNSIHHEFTYLNNAITLSGDSNHLGSFDLTGGGCGNNYVLNIPAYYDSSPDTTAVSISGYTTSATNYIKIYTPTSTTAEANNSQRASGKWDNTKYSLQATNSGSYINGILINEDYVRIDGLQISVTSSTGSNGGIYGSGQTASSNDIRISNNLIKSTLSGTANTNFGIYINSDNVTGLKIWNNILYGFNFNAGDICIAAARGTAFVYNNTVRNCTTGINGSLSGNNATAKNNIAQNTTTGYSGTFNGSSTNNLSDHADAPGSNPQNGVTVSFANTTPGSEDLHLASTDTGAFGEGADLTSDSNLPITTDIDGQNRPNMGNYSWDIGADQAIHGYYMSVGQNTDTNYSSGGNVTVSGIIANFTVPQTDAHVGVGDVLTYGGSNSCVISRKISTSSWVCLSGDTAGAPTAASGVAVTDIHHGTSSLYGAAMAAAFLSDLVALNWTINIACYYDSGPDTTAVTVAGITTDATHYVRIYTPYDTTNEVNQSQRASGKWDDGKYSITNISTNSVIYISYVDYVRIDGLQFKANNSIGIDFFLSSSSSDLQFSNNIITVINDTGSNSGIHTGSWVPSDTAKIWNNIIYGFSATNDIGINVINASGGITAYVYNNTVYGNTTGIQMGGNYPTLKNNLSYSNTTDYYALAAYSGTHSNNISHDNTSPDAGSTDCGGHSCQNQTVSFVDATNKDFHLTLTDSAAKDHGVNLSNDANLPFSTDIDGAQRPATGDIWDIGADEVTQATVNLHNNVNLGRNVNLKAGGVAFPPVWVWNQNHTPAISDSEAADNVHYLDGGLITAPAGSSKITQAALYVPDDYNTQLFNFCVYPSTGGAPIGTCGTATKPGNNTGFYKLLSSTMNVPVTPGNTYFVSFNVDGGVPFYYYGASSGKYAYNGSWTFTSGTCQNPSGTPVSGYGIDVGAYFQ